MVKHISDRVLVMYLGHAVELGTYDEVYNNPLHPYTRALMSACWFRTRIEQNKTIQLLEGELPSPINPPSGCVFVRAVRWQGQKCAKTRPLLEGSFRHAVSCLKVDPLYSSGLASCQPFYFDEEITWWLLALCAIVFIISYSINVRAPADGLKRCADCLRS
ncbi:oligopeptide/dipeptide ABC transporter ATP-binding protein [Escherichia coli]